MQFADYIFPASPHHSSSPPATTNEAAKYRYRSSAWPITCCQ